MITNTNFSSLSSTAADVLQSYRQNIFSSFSFDNENTQAPVIDASEFRIRHALYGDTTPAGLDDFIHVYGSHTDGAIGRYIHEWVKRGVIVTLLRVYG
jgi:hypothetical protein